MERKEVDTQQFIDHTLLATELMHNNFMMDLIDHSGVFPKAVDGPTNLSTPGNTANGEAESFVAKQTLTPELNFHNTIFQFVNKHVVVDETNTTRSNAVSTSPQRRRSNYDKQSDVEFLTINSSFLNAAADGAVAASADVGENDVVPQQESQPAFPAMAIEPTVPIDDDLLYAHSVSTTNARKVLPHKKRISRKLKGNLSSMESEMEPQHQHQHQHKHHVQLPVVSTYSCEICGYVVHTQIEFYAHLKEHYDPSNLVQRLDVPQQQQQQQQQKQKESLDMCGLTAQDKLEQEQAKLDQVFHDVQLNFENFHNISHVDDDVGVNMVIHSDAISLSSKTDDKLTPVGSTNAATSNVVPVVDDVEFSDTEDMLEGIRNVVDKVSIEDTCDELVDLELTTSAMRAPWFNNNFTDIAFPGLLLPGEPPPNSTPLLKTNHIEADEQMTLNFLNTSKQVRDQAVEAPAMQSKLEMCHKKNYIESTAAAAMATAASASAAGAATDNCIRDNNNEQQTLLMPQPSRTPTPTASGSAIEQLQRSPLIISDAFKLEDVEGTAQADSLASSPAASSVMYENDMYRMDAEDRQPISDEATSDTSKRKYQCNKCVRGFNSYNSLKYHQYTHNQERAFQCIDCERSFYTKSALKAHARTHSSLKPFKCEQCDHQCRQWGDLKYHITSKHSDIKAHMCEFCGKSFSRKYSLVVHRRIHTSERNYVCQYCQKTFRASSYLLAHVKVHTGEKPYSCAICEKKFRVNSDLKRHARIHDPERARSTPKTTASGSKNLDNNIGSGSSRSKLTQIADDDDDDEDVNTINKSDAVCGENDQEILGL